ncbi:MAG: glucose-6-phosphate isomerase [Verrucomicrobiales bacterium]|nr:glucose-6-phosphate isomerase [Verrucomicrobiales bacterium]
MTQPSKSQLWDRFQSLYSDYPELGLSLDLSRMNFPADFLQTMSTPIQKALVAMAELEKGGIANPDEKRMVGHYWLRNSSLAPTASMAKEIEDTIVAVKAFAEEVHGGKISGARGPFKNLLVIGIGGSALGPQFVAHALGHSLTDKMSVSFFDNTDPDGMDKVLAQVITELGQTLCVVISKSGGTKETRNGMLEAQTAYERAGLSFAAHAVAVTGFGSELDRYATQHGWLRRFPMWDWVGGRTSVLSAVGLLPAALQGLDIDGMLKGARACDDITRRTELRKNPAALLSLMWYYSGNGRGSKDMVVLPYKDRLELFSKYLQQLIMESLGKELNLEGQVVNQGIAVYGNKGSTDQHAYIQQLREGLHNFFVTFIEVLKDRSGASMEVEPGVTSGDFLSGFYLGTRQALYEKGRESVSLIVSEVSGFSVGVLIALFERAVGLYATLVNINAYHQPGVEAGKKAAGSVISLQSQVVKYLKASPGQSFTVTQLAGSLGSDDPEMIFKICEHLSANVGRGITKVPANTPFTAGYRAD